jgi:hypothetical protein
MGNSLSYLLPHCLLPLLLFYRVKYLLSIEKITYDFLIQVSQATAIESDSSTFVVTVAVGDSRGSWLFNRTLAMEATTTNH